ncbi:cleavage and polyadenylation specificity factor (CPSF) A subunit protein [Actinidia rufa]|uniref:Cleavage and polyadenylation specificity factor (CPSF) A subunit protein n=1 Tax=Actinidia rufa TaxID=165716 RepID=A0A7J0E736_9ERIC|nr:cleavage and polyadenylation specificity factor (CPSF) A subunit protein [Actinidia rufa]
MLDYFFGITVLPFSTSCCQVDSPLSMRMKMKHAFFKMSRFDEGEIANRLALFEDFELRGFLPLVLAQLILDFLGKHVFGSAGGSKGKSARVQRIIEAGKGKKEDEVIVFKPPLSEKHADGVGSKLSASQSAPNTSSRPPTSLSNTTAQYLHRIQANTSIRLAEQASSNELSYLHLTADGFPMKHELHGHLGSMQPTALSVPYPHQFVNLIVGNKYPFQVPETAVPSKFDSVMSSGTIVDSLSTKPSSIMPAVLRKNPVSRPLPGFNSVPPKLVDDYLSGVALKNENPPKDDYCWLDRWMPVGFINTKHWWPGATSSDFAFAVWTKLFCVGAWMVLDVSDEIEEDPTGGKIKWEQGKLNGAPNKMEEIVQFHVGDVVTSMQKASLIPSGGECLIYGTVMGSLGALLAFTSRDDVDFFSHLEMHMRQEHPPLCGRDHMAYRSAYFPVKIYELAVFTPFLRVLKSVTVRALCEKHPCLLGLDVIDGDLCEQFPTLPMDLQRKIADELDRTPGEILKKLEEVRNKII